MVTPQLLLLRSGLLLRRLAAAREPVGTPRPVSRLDVPWWRERWATKRAELGASRPELVFLGDSITQNWELAGPGPDFDMQPVWQRFYGHRRGANLGYAGDATDNLLWRLRNGELDGQRPRLVVVMIGANDIVVHARRVETVLAGIAAVCQEVRRRLPRSGLLLVGLLPNRISGWITRRTERVNAVMLAPGWAPPGTATVDAGRALVRHARLDPTLFSDRLVNPALPILLHPNAAGQGRVAAAIEPAIASMLAGSR